MIHHTRSSRGLPTTTGNIRDGELCNYHCEALHLRCLVGSYLHLWSSICFHLLFFVVLFTIFWTFNICFTSERLEKLDVFSDKSNTSSHSSVFYLSRQFQHIYRHVLVSLLLTLSRRRPMLYRNQSIHLQCKPMDWFLHDMDLCH